MEVVGGFSLSRKGKYLTPQSVAVIEGGTVTIHILSTPFHYYFLPGVTGSIGVTFGGLVGLLVGVAVGIAVTLYLQRWKYGRAIRKIETGETSVSPDIVAKKGKVRRVEVEEGRFGKSLHVETPKQEFSLTGEAGDVDRVYESMV